MNFYFDEECPYVFTSSIKKTLPYCIKVPRECALKVTLVLILTSWVGVKSICMNCLTLLILNKFHDIAHWLVYHSNKYGTRSFCLYLFYCYFSYLQLVESNFSISDPVIHFGISIFFKYSNLYMVKLNKIILDKI